MLPIHGDRVQSLVRKVDSIGQNESLHVATKDPAMKLEGPEFCIEDPVQPNKKTNILKNDLLTTLFFPILQVKDIGILNVQGRIASQSGYNIVLVTQLCLTLCHTMDCSPQVSSVHGIPQARILEWVAIPFSRGSSQPRD